MERGTRHSPRHRWPASEVRSGANGCAAEMRRTAYVHSATSAAEVAAAAHRMWNSAATEMRRSTSAAVTAASTSAPAPSSRGCASGVR
jgi:hypothetical protein